MSFFDQLFSGGGRTHQTTTTTELDPSTQAFLDQYRQNVNQGFQQLTSGESRVPGVDPLFQDSLNQLQQFGGPFGPIGQLLGMGSNLGFASQTGLRGLDAYFNPFQEEVIGGLQADFDRQRGLATVGAGQAATGAGAFGGNRQAILEAQMQNDINQSEGQTLANVRSGGFQNAVSNLLAERGRAGQLGLSGLGLGGQLGFGLSGMLNQMGMQRRGIEEAIRRDPDQRMMAALGLYSPHAVSSQGAGTVTEEQPIYSSPFGGALGGFLGAAGNPATANPYGMAAGAGMGFLGGFFG